MAQFFKEMLRFGRYKSTQGRTARQLTMLTVIVMFAIAAWRIYEMGFTGIPFLKEPAFRSLLAAVVAFGGGWFAYRLVQFPPFADFLVAVEAEMIKVYWPPKSELYSSTIVVLIVFVLLSAMIFLFDNFWVILFRWLTIIPKG